MQQNFDRSHVTLFAELVNALHPGAGGRTIAKLLDHRARRTAVLNWRAGRRGTPQWALDLLAAKLHARSTEHLAIVARAKQAPPRPSLKAGAANIRAWHARRPR